MLTGAGLRGQVGMRQQVSGGGGRRGVCPEMEGEQGGSELRGDPRTEQGPELRGRGPVLSGGGTALSGVGGPFVGSLHLVRGP